MKSPGAHSHLGRYVIIILLLSILYTADSVQQKSFAYIFKPVDYAIQKPIAIKIMRIILAIPDAVIQ